MEDRASTSSAATRQKSCNACVKTKRRCDKRTPVCSRCAEKQWPCIYRRRRGGDTLPDLLHTPSPDASLSTPSASWFLGDPVDLAFEPDGSFDMDMSALEPLQTGAISPGALMNDMWLAPLQDSSGVEYLDREVPEEKAVFCVADYAKINNMCEQFQPWQLYDPNTRVHYIYHVQKNFHVEFAQKNQTPFMHKTLYQDHMPDCILQCFTLSSLYVNQTAENKVLVFRTLQQCLSQLLGNCSLAVVATTPVERLARTQSLLLYQTIRLFDGDITLRSQGEQDMELLQSWANDLCKIRENLGNLSDMDGHGLRENPPASWQRWVFAESMRRTILMAYSLISSYQVLSSSVQDSTPIGPWAFIHRWTLSRHLWEASTSYDFYRAWREKPQYIVRNFDIAAFLKSGRADDVDDMAKMILHLYLGLDEAREFLESTNSNTTQRAETNYIM